MPDNKSETATGMDKGKSPDFSLEAASGRENLNSCGVCPLAQIPAKVWTQIFRQPFRKRHPLIFWGLCLLLLALAAFLGRFSAFHSPGERLALINVRGPILNASPTLEWIRQLEKDAAVRGILLRVDSPGGGAAASQEIYDALARLAAKKTIAVSMGATAASGGLMVSMAAERIFANPSTVTGSIGVRMDIPQLQGLLDKLGVGQETLVTAPFKDAASYLRPLSPADRAYFEHLLMDMHEQFVDIVAKGRHMDREQAARLANGKIFTGQEALGLGLIDALGGETAALEWLAEKTGIPSSQPLLRKEEATRTTLLERLLAGLASAFGLNDILELTGSMPLSKSGLGPAFLYQM